MSMSTEPQPASPETPWSWRFAFASNTDLDKAAKAVLQVIAMHTNDCGEGCFPSIETIALESGYSKRSVILAIQDAAEKGWLKIEKHGFAGQKWKRNHYIPQWPERQYGGAATAPPSEKVVQSTQEGGAVHDQKVVQPLHSNIPINNPIESLSAEALEKEVSDSGFDKKAIEKQFKAFGPTWPTWVDDSEKAARTAWVGLTDSQREEAVARKDDYLVASKAGGRTTTCALGTYLAQLRWEKLEAAPAKADGPRRLNIYGSGWMAHRLALLAGGRSQWKPTAMMQKMMQTGNAALFDDDRRRGEFPLVTRMDKEAENGRGVPLPKDVSALDTTGFVKMKVGSDLWQQWADWHESMDYPWIDPPRHIEWMWVPEAVPEIAGVSDDEDLDFIEASR